MAAPRPSTDAAVRAELASIALLCAREAGALVSAGFRSRPRVDLKGERDLVTEYDRASEELLVARLGSLAPGIPIVAEERWWAAERTATDLSRGRAADPDVERGAGDGGEGSLVWYVDPLDGTTNFVHGHPFWCVAIGLCDAGQPVAGAIVAPSVSLTWVGWHGEVGSTALRNGQPCSVSGTERLADALVATGFPAQRDHHPDNNFGSFISVKRQCQGVRRCGSAAMDLCLVADGTYDAYWERRLSAWDVVAGSAIVLAAGGRVTSLDGGEPDWSIGHVIASNGRVHREIVDAVEGPRTRTPTG